jgi:hypothetical protein
MDFVNFRLTKWKIVFMLVPFVFPLFQLWLATQIYFDLYLSVDSIFFDLEEMTVNLMHVIEIFFATPFESLLGQLGWWSSNGIFVVPDGPLLPGSFAVAITYSLLIYLVWSLVKVWRKRV